MVLLVLCLCRNHIAKRLSTKHRKLLYSYYRMFFWNMFIRTGSELFYPLLLTSCLSIMETRRASANIKNIVIVVVGIAYMAFTLIFMQKHKDDVGLPQFQEPYGAFMTNLETYKKPKAVYYPFVFLLRRASLVLIIIFLRVNLIA